jgi:cellulose synthase/poly-beta-1,6-N-acetylglucosamine synthase-like glycosyltransferase
MINIVLEALFDILQSHSTFADFLLLFTPFVLLLELPLLFMVILGIFIWANKEQKRAAFGKHMPKVTCTLLCYSEGEDIIEPIYSLAHQLYPGEIEILVIIDGALANKKTHSIALSLKDEINTLTNRELKVIPKYKRGGRVSSMNLGMQLASGKIFMALDGDTTFDNDMVIKAVQNFDNPDVVAVAGNLRVKNARDSLATRLQAIEYMLSITAGRTGLASFNMVNNISGAFGIFRIEILKMLMGWDSGTAEDFDITMRLKEHFARHPNWRIVFDPHVIGHTEVPNTFLGFFNQRIRWEGDLFYVLIRKYINNIRPSLLGGLNYLFTLVGVYFFQIIMPFVITLYTIMMLIFIPLDYILGLSIIVYIFYFIMLFIFYILYIFLISERAKEDLEYLFYLPLFPMFTFVARINAALALLHSIINKSHLDSNMAPWWVLKRGNY